MIEVPNQLNLREIILDHLGGPDSARTEAYLKKKKSHPWIAAAVGKSSSLPSPMACAADFGWAWPPVPGTLTATA